MKGLYLSIIKKKHFDLLEATNDDDSNEIIKLVESGVGILTRICYPNEVFYYHKFNSVAAVPLKELSFGPYDDIRQTTLSQYENGFLTPYEGGVFVSMAILQLIDSNEQTKKTLVSKIVLDGIEAIYKLISKAGQKTNYIIPWLSISTNRSWTLDETYRGMARAQVETSWLSESDRFPEEELTGDNINSRTEIFRYKLLELEQFSRGLLDDISCELHKLYNAVWNSIGVNFCVEDTPFVFMTTETLRKTLVEKKFIPRLGKMSDITFNIGKGHYTEALIVNEKTAMDLHMLTFRRFNRKVLLMTPSDAPPELKKTFLNFEKTLLRLRIIKEDEREKAPKTTYSVISKTVKIGLISEEEGKTELLKIATEFDESHYVKDMATKVADGFPVVEDVPPSSSSSGAEKKITKRIQIFGGAPFLTVYLFMIDLEHLSEITKDDMNVVLSLLNSYPDVDIVITTPRLSPFDINATDRFFIFRPSEKRRLKFFQEEE